MSSDSVSGSCTGYREAKLVSLLNRGKRACLVPSKEMARAVLNARSKLREEQQERVKVTHVIFPDLPGNLEDQAQIRSREAPGSGSGYSPTSPFTRASTHEIKPLVNLYHQFPDLTENCLRFFRKKPKSAVSIHRSQSKKPICGERKRNDWRQSTTE